MSCSGQFPRSEGVLVGWQRALCRRLAFVSYLALLMSFYALLASSSPQHLKVVNSGLDSFIQERAVKGESLGKD